MTDDKDKKAKERTAPQDPEPTDDDGWGEAAADAGWGPAMPSARAEDKPAAQDKPAAAGKPAASGKPAAQHKPAAQVAKKAATDEAWERPRPREEQQAPVHYVPADKAKADKAKADKSPADKAKADKAKADKSPDTKLNTDKAPRAEPEPPAPRKESLRSAVGIDKKPSRAERAKTKAAAKAKAARAKVAAKAAAKAEASARGKTRSKPKRSRADTDSDEPRKRRLSPRATLFLVIAAVASVGVAALVALGMFNSKQYFLVCHAKEITAERGRQFPPWGRSPLSGDAWKPIAIPPNTECVDATTEDRRELEVLYADALYMQADKRLLSRDAGQIDEAAKQLTQALLLTRDPERKQKRDAITRLQGDVDYARARAQAAAAAATLQSAAKQFEQAAQKLPRHTRDSAAWAAYARRISDELARGPTELRKTPAPGPENRDAAPTGSRPGPTPPPRDAGVPAPLPVDAEPGTALPPESDATPAPPDAGLPSGGVLL